MPNITKAVDMNDVLDRTDHAGANPGVKTLQASRGNPVDTLIEVCRLGPESHFRILNGVGGTPHLNKIHPGVTDKQYHANRITRWHNTDLL